MKEILSEILENPISTVGLCAFALSILSMIITFIQMRRQKLHFHNSLKPIAKFVFGDYEEELLAKIENNGVGPLLIDKVEFIKNNNQTKSNLVDWLSTSEFEDFIQEFTNRAISPNNHCIVFQKKFSDDESTLRDKTRRELDGIVGKITYKDVYNNQFIEERDFSWFSRLLDK